MCYDVVIVGGGMFGSSLAFWLSKEGQGDLKIAVIESDPSYRFAATTHTNSCIRQQFGTKTNIAISQFGAQFIENFRDFMGDDAPDIPIQSYGYMYLAGDDAGAQTLKRSVAVQRELGAATRMLSPRDIKAAYPFYNVDDILCGSHNRVNEGYFDGGTVFDWFRKKARAAGVTYVHGTVTGIEASGALVTAVTLADGQRLSCGATVNCAGTRASALAELAGLAPLPIEPRKRFTYIFAAAEPLDRDLPLTIDPSGVHMRSDGAYYLAGCPPDEDPAVDPMDFDVPPNIWEEKVWPVLAHRVPAFERIKLINEWAGHYDYNTFDQNALLGPVDGLENFYFCNGFSGHGLQQSPAIGRGLSELILTGSYQTLDLSPLSANRLAKNAPYVEPAII